MLMLSELLKSIWIDFPVNNTNIYKLNIDTISRSEFGAAYFLMADERKARCDSYFREDDKKRCIAADMLLRRVLSEAVGIPEKLLEFGIYEKGKPYLKNQKCFFSVSHSGKAVAVAVNKDSEVGIDIEELRPVKASVAKHFFTQNEIEFVFRRDFIPDGIIEDRETLERFFKVWTYKEAYVKMTGKGITDDIKKISYDEKNCECEINEDYCLTVITKK